MSLLSTYYFIRERLNSPNYYSIGQFSMISPLMDVNNLHHIDC